MAKADNQPAETVLTFHDETTIHGVKEAASSPVKYHRYMWLVAMGVGFIAMSIQMREVAMRFAGDEAGTFIATYALTKMPGVMLCPRFNPFKPYGESGITEEMEQYISAYAPFSTEFYLAMDVVLGKEKNPVTPETIKSVEAVIRSFNSSIQKFIFAKAVEPNEIIRDFQFYPHSLGSSESAKRKALFTSFGICYFLQPEQNVDPGLAQFASLDVWVSAERTAKNVGGVDALFTVFVGDFDTLAVSPPVAGRVGLPRNSHAYMKVRITKKSRYPGRSGKRCRNYKKNDEAYCISEQVNRHFCDRCQSQTPASSTYAEAIQKPEELCNFYHPDRFPCLADITSSNFAEIAKVCPPPCEEEVFDYTTVMANSNSTGVGVSFDNLALSATVVEYPLITMTDVLSSTGGTMGLYFGASLLSMFQILFYCGATAKKCCQKGKTDLYKWK